MGSIADKPAVSLNVDAGARPRTAAVRHLSRRFEVAATAAEIVGDFLAAMLALLVSYKAYCVLHLGKQVYYSPNLVLIASGFLGILFVLLLDREGAYREANGLLRVKETERVLRVSAQAFVLVLPITFFAAEPVSRLLLGFAFLLLPFMATCEKQLCFLCVRTLRGRGFGAKKVLIYGAGYTGQRVFSALTNSPKLGLDPIAFVDDSSEVAGNELYAFGYRRQRSAKILAGPITAEMIRELGVDTVMVAVPSLSRERFAAAISAVTEAQARIAFVPSQIVPSDSWIDYLDVDGLMIASFGKPQPKSLYEFGKRMIDLTVAVLISVVCAPALLLIAAAIRLDSSGPVLFRQIRVGRYGKPFSMYKFRTMRADAPAYGFSPKESQDPRITGVGRFLRRASLDELPQLLNVIKGNMSLVGPRPEMPFIVEQYNERHRQRLNVKPGITCLWQLSADRAFLIHENIQYDLYYIRNRSLFMDLAILLHTVLFAMRGV